MIFLIELEELVCLVMLSWRLVVHSGEGGDVDNFSQF